MSEVAAGLVLADRYVVADRVGGGGAGTVWRGHDRVLDRPVAIKVVPAGVEASRLAREARASAGVSGRNVVSVYDHGEQQGIHYLVMELVDGVDLGTLLAVHGALPSEVVTVVGCDVARGLATVHEAGIVHRDLSPSNVLVSTDGQVRLVDFGGARQQGEEPTRQITEVGTVVGTIDYLAPEQVEGGEVTAASDVYALGLLLHALATGRAPFGDGSVAERLARRVVVDPARLDDQPAALAEVVARAVRRDPGDRPQDGRQVLQALLPLLPTDESDQRELLAALVVAAREVEQAPPAQDTTVVLDVADTRAVTDDATDEHHTAPVAAGAAFASSTAPPRSTSDRGDPTQVHAPVAGAPAGGADGVGHARSADSDSRGLLLPVLASLLAGAVLVAVAVGVGTGGGADDGGTTVDGDTVTIAAAADHDPLGDGDEHPDSVTLAIDGDPATAWDTEGYTSADLGGLKAGVGLLLDLGVSTDVGAVELELATVGGDVTVTVSEERPAGDPRDAATVLGTASGLQGTVTVSGEAVQGRWVALWFTALGDDGGEFRTEVREVRVLAP